MIQNVAETKVKVCLDCMRAQRKGTCLSRRWLSWVSKSEMQAKDRRNIPVDNKVTADWIILFSTFFCCCFYSMHLYTVCCGASMVLGSLYCICYPISLLQQPDEIGPNNFHMFIIRRLRLREIKDLPRILEFNNKIWLILNILTWLQEKMDSKTRV